MTQASRRLQLQQLQQRLGHQFEKVALLQLALTHRSAGKNNNERLEFLGDSLINHIIAERLYCHFPSAREGQLSRLRAKLVRGTYLAQIAQGLDISCCLILGAGERKGGGRQRGSILADALEAITGAVFLDAGFDTTRTVVNGWFYDSFLQLSLDDERDAKTRLQEWLQGRGLPLPRYEVRAVEGADHDQRFSVVCVTPAMPEAVQGQGTSRRSAEQDAARKTLEKLNEQ